MDYELYQMATSTNGHRSHSHNGEIDKYTMHVRVDSTRAQRIRAAIFPETIEDGSPLSLPSSTQVVNRSITAVQKLSEPSQLLRNAVNDIINYKEDAEITEKALPELIRLLNDDDPIIAGQAALILHTLAKKEASRLALSTPQMIQALIQAISNPRVNNDIQQGVAGVLHCLSQQKQGLFVIFKGGGIPLLIKLLDSSIESVIKYVLSTLHHLLLHIEQAKLEILRCGGCQKMVGLLNNTNPKFIALLTDCLHILAFNNEEVKIIIESSNGPQQLLQILKLNNYEKLLWTITRLLHVLSVSPSIKIVMIDNHAIEILEKQLYQPISLRIQQNCLQILRNLSDQAVKLENLDSLLRLLIKFLSTNDFITISCSIGILSNLTCNNQYNKMIVVQSNGIPALINTIIHSQNKEEILEPSICALRHLTCRHSYAHEAQNIVRNVNGLLPIVNLLNPIIYSWSIIKSTISLIRNLALAINNLSILRETGVIHKLAQLLVQKQSNEEFLCMDEILEGCVSALHILAKDQQNRNIIRDLDCIPLFVRLLYPPSNISIQRATTGVLCELVNDPLCAEIILQQNCTQKLTDLLKSNDEGVATYTAAILFRLSDDQSNDLKNRLSQDVMSALHRPILIHDAPAMNYYVSEGSAGTGLG